MRRSTIFSGPGGAVAAILVLAAVALLANWLDAPPPAVGGLARVSDGDSFHLGDARVRLLGLDAPELAQQCQASDQKKWPCGRRARDRMASLLNSGPVACQPQGHDRYGRLLAHCQIDGRDLGAIMVSEGLAISAGDYWAEQSDARAAQRGIWAGGFDTPADWRDDHPRPAGLLRWIGL